MKILRCHVLLKYDFKLAEGSVPQFRRQGFALHADASASISIRRWREAIVLKDITIEFLALFCSSEVFPP